MLTRLDRTLHIFVLVVDDDHNIRGPATRLLTKEGLWTSVPALILDQPVLWSSWPYVPLFFINGKPSRC